MNNLVYFSMVGKQPAALAVTVRTLCQAGMIPGEIVLMHTGGPAGTAPQAARLQAFFERARKTWWHDRGRITLLEYQHNTQEAIAEVIQLHSAHATIIYDCSPGLNYQQAALAHLLKDCPIKVVYTEERNLVGLQDNPLSLVNIGLTNLLELHRLSCQYHNGTFRIMNGRDQLVELDTLYELRGRLYGALERPIPDKDNARRISANLQGPAWNYLRIRVLLRTREWSVYQRLVADGRDVCFLPDPRSTGRKSAQLHRHAERIIQRWQKQNPIPPGRRYAGPAEQDTAPPDSVDGKGGDGKPLVLCLGNDPSATLLALCSHQPKRALIYYDAGIAAIRGLAARLADKAGLIPAGRLCFQKTDLVGNKGISRQNILQVLGLDENTEIHANISPGTKAQAWRLARLEGIIPWSIDNKTRLLTSVCGSGSRPLGKVPTLLQASVCGGPLNDQGHSVNKMELPGLLVLARLAARETDSPGRPFRLKDRRWKIDKTLVTAAYNQKLGQWGVTVWPDQGRQIDLVFPARNRHDGFWLEEVVAAALHEAGLEDIRVGVRWAWITDRNSGNAFRTELDVIGRWETNFVAVSVKSALQYEQREESLEQARSEIIHEARARLGRFCLPVLVAPVPPSLAKERPLTIGIHQLGDFKALGATIAQALDDKKTAYMPLRSMAAGDPNTNNSL